MIRSGALQSIILTFLMVGLMAVLAGCASPTMTALENALETTPPAADPFARALSNEYHDVARFEKSQMLDLKDYPYFAEKGLIAATADTATTPLPADPRDWSLNAYDQRRLRAARHRLAAKLANGADTALPKSAAGAQVSYDCWVEQQEEGYQPDDIAACRDRFNQSMTKIDALKAPPRAVFFPLDSAWLDRQARNTVKQMAAKAIRLKAPRVTIQGHTDRTGSAAHNVRLSLRRADEVRAVLIAEGVAPERIAVSAAGESRLRTPTRDNVAHRDNRRVELTFQQYEKW
jgi:OmpA-OmpF porin, OOP family